MEIQIFSLLNTYDTAEIIEFSTKKTFLLIRATSKLLHIRDDSEFFFISFS